MDCAGGSALPSSQLSGLALVSTIDCQADSALPTAMTENPGPMYLAVLPPCVTHKGMPPLVLSNILELIIKWTSPEPQSPEFHFAWNKGAAKHNLKVLKQYDMDLKKALPSQPFSGITYGSEFGPAPVLAPLLRSHPLWHWVREYLTVSSTRYGRSAKSIAYTHDLSRMLKYGNHKSADMEKPCLLSMLQDEVHRM